MRRRSVTRFLPTACVRRLPFALWCLLIAILVTQVAAPRQVTAFCAAGSYEESEEDRDSDESANEQELSLYLAPTSRVRRMSTLIGRPLMAHQARRPLRIVVASSFCGEHAYRNGVGGPLRC
jgi:hypothetical protein